MIIESSEPKPKGDMHKKKRIMEGEGKVENCNTLSSLKFTFYSHFQLELKLNNGTCQPVGLLQM